MNSRDAMETVLKLMFEMYNENGKKIDLSRIVSAIEDMTNDNEFLFDLKEFIIQYYFDHYSMKR